MASEDQLPSVDSAEMHIEQAHGPGPAHDLPHGKSWSAQRELLLECDVNTVGNVRD